MDHASTTPVRPEVLEVMLPYFSDYFGNPSSLYAVAEDARNALDDARESIASVLNARTSEIVFTSGGTESDNTAIKGAAYALEGQGRHIIISAIEHHAVFHPAEQMERRGWQLTVIPVNRDGLVDPIQVAAAVRKDTTVVSIMYANNEVGTVQDIARISELVHNRAEEMGTTIAVHTDAVQSAGKLPLDVKALGVDLMSLSGHKIYGPKGSGVLFVKRGTPLELLLAGGGQERQRRSGTENVPGIVGMGKALELADAEREDFVRLTFALRSKLMQGLTSAIPDIYINSNPDVSLPNILNVSFRGIAGEHIIVSLDFASVCASSGSACSSASVEPSHVLLALGMNADEAAASVRFSLGRTNTEDDVDYVIRTMPDIVTILEICPLLLWIYNHLERMK